MTPGRRLLVVAAAAAALGLVAGLWHGRSPLQDSEAGQRALQAAANASAPAPPAGETPA